MITCENLCYMFCSNSCQRRCTGTHYRMLQLKILMLAPNDHHNIVPETSHCQTVLFSHTRFTIFSKRLVLEPNVKERHVCDPVILLTIFAFAQPMINSAAYLNPPKKHGQLNTIHPNMKQRPRKISIHIYIWKRFYSHAQRNHNQETPDCSNPVRNGKSIHRAHRGQRERAP